MPRFNGVFYHAHGNLHELSTVELRHLKLLMWAGLGFSILVLIIAALTGGAMVFGMILGLVVFLLPIFELVVYARIKYIRVVYFGEPLFNSYQIKNNFRKLIRRF